MPTLVATPEPSAIESQAAGRYARRQPETTVLYQTVEEHLPALLVDAADRSEHGFGYPRFVHREFDKFLECGILSKGFVRVRCDDCADERLVAFSCKTRGICPSCTSRRMAATAAHLVEHVLPAVPYRQWVISFPRRVRFALARDHVLLSHVLRIVVGKISAWQKRCARTLGVRSPHCGVLTFVQRFGSLVNLNCHFHCLVPEGVFARGLDDRAIFTALPPPWDHDIERLLLQIGSAVEKRLRRDDDTDPHDLDTHDLLASEQLASLSAGTPSTAQPVAARPSRRCAFLQGYSMHADRVLEADDRDGLERLCRYGARAPIANSRLSRSADGNALVLELKRPLRDGRTSLSFSPRELLRRLATLIPPPRRNLTRYHGLFAPNHHLRAAIVPRNTDTELQPPASDSTTTPSRPRRIDWATLMKRVFAIDVFVCDRCQGPMRIVALLPESDITERILDHIARRQRGREPRAPPPTRKPPPQGAQLAH